MRKFILSLLFLGPGLLQAAQRDFAAGNAAAPWLNVPASTRAAAMGQASVALAGDADGVSANPALLGQLKARQLALGHNAWFQSASFENAAFAMPLGEASGLGAGIHYQNLGSVDKYSVDSAGQLQSAGAANPAAYDADLAFGMAFSTALSLGLNAKFISQSLDGDNASAFAADFGLQSQTPFGIRLGLALQNMGTPLGGSDLPTSLRAGIGAQGSSEGQQMAFAADLNVPAQGYSSAGLGLEYGIQDSLAFRLGYRAQQNSGGGSQGGLSAGLGLHLAWAKVDYAFQSFGDLGNGNQFSISSSF